MKVIFLDFDGVINNWASQDEVDELNVKILKDIIDASGAKVIAITSNKYPFQLKKEKSMLKTQFGRDILQLKRLGVTIDGVTPLVNCNRALEIIEYLNANKDVQNYVILDDEVIENEQLIDHQVYLDLYKGLQEEHKKPALDILNGRLGFYPKDYNRNETSEDRIRRINEYYNSRENAADEKCH